MSLIRINFSVFLFLLSVSPLALSSHYLFLLTIPCHSIFSMGFFLSILHAVGSIMNGSEAQKIIKPMQFPYNDYQWNYNIFTYRDFTIVSRLPHHWSLCSSFNLFHSVYQSFSILIVHYKDLSRLVLLVCLSHPSLRPKGSNNDFLSNSLYLLIS